MNKKICNKKKSSFSEVNLLKQILKTSNLLYDDLIFLICEYLVLLFKHIKFYENISNLYFYKSPISQNVQIAIQLNMKVYLLDDQRWLKLRERQDANLWTTYLISEENANIEDIYTAYYTGTNNNMKHTFILAPWNDSIKKIQPEHHPQSVSFICSEWPRQFFMFQTNTNNIWIFYSDFKKKVDKDCPKYANLYYFDKENQKEHKLPFKTRSHLTWCIWKNVLIFLHVSCETICFYDILTGQVQDTCDFRGFPQTKFMIFPIKIIMSLKKKLYFVDEKNNLYIYS